MTVKEAGASQHVEPDLATRELRLVPASQHVEPDLATLATRHGTDKWNAHWYAQHYERHFAPWRHKPVRLLEIGIGGMENPKAGGESLRMWKEFFPLGSIVGLDLYDKRPHAEDRIRIFQGHQADRNILRRITQECGPFDLIVDDGSHLPWHVVSSFEFLFENSLVEGGIYAVEDLQTSYWTAYGGATRIHARSTSMGYLKTLCDRVNFREWHRPGYKPSYIDLHVVGLHFYHNLAFVEKGRNDEASTIVKDNYVPREGRLTPLGQVTGLVRRSVGRLARYLDDRG